MSFNKPIKPATDIEGVRRSALWHLGQRDHSEQELRTKLGRKTDQQQWIDRIILECYEYNYLNDQRFVDSFIRASQNKNYGIARIKRDLKQKGITTAIIEKTIAENDYDYMSSILSLLNKKYSTQITNPSIKQKAMVFLQNKGHSFDDIFKAIELHNEALPADECDYLTEATSLLSRKFKTIISERKIRDKAMRFLLSKGYSYSNTQNAIQIHNEQIDSDMQDSE